MRALPCREGSAAVELTDLLRRGEQHVLGDFLDIPDVAQPPADHLLDPAGVSLDEPPGRTRVVALKPLHQVPICRGGRGHWLRACRLVNWHAVRVIPSSDSW